MVVAGLANAVAEIPQAWTVIKTGDTNSISLTMFWLFLFIQSSFGLQAYVNKDRVMMYSLMVSGMFTAIILVSATYLRCR